MGGMESRTEGEKEKEMDKDPKWPSEADEEATRELVALGDEKGMSGVDLVHLYLHVEAILMRHDRNPRKLLDAMHHLSRTDAGNE
jgi:hypothetical protein